MRGRKCLAQARETTDSETVKNDMIRTALYRQSFTLSRFVWIQTDSKTGDTSIQIDWSQ